MTIHRYFVPAPRGLVDIVADELRSLGAGSVRVGPSGCRVRGPLSFGYRMCLWSRTAGRVLLGLAEVVAGSADELYEALKELAWEDHIDPDGTFMVDFVGEGAGITHTGFGARRVKDAIVDRFRDRTGRRPSVDRVAPDVRVHVFVQGRGCSISIDLAGDSLHRRGYRTASGPAPLRETLAAAMLAIGGWSGLACAGCAFIDPLAGAGTLAIEAAMVALDVAPGLRRPGFGFTRWRGHDPEAWSTLLAEAREREVQGKQRGAPPIVAVDRDNAVVEIARNNAKRAEVQSFIQFECRDLDEVERPATSSGLLATNPPYGERIGTPAQARHTVAALTRLLQERFQGWSAVVILPEDAGVALGLSPASSTPVSNGPIEARIDLVNVAEDAAPAFDEDNAFARRLSKNAKHLRRWAKREAIECYRVYDADIPEYNVAVDLYGDHVHLQEYEAPSVIDPSVASRRLGEVLAAVPAVLGIRAEAMHLKVRRRQRGKAQYERQATEGQSFVVHEGGHPFEVNLDDYLDTGLFLDHRKTRKMLAEWARGKRFLNLFCYTASATVYAAKGGARATTSVDLSNTYLEWAERNFRLAGISGPEHRLVRADVREWLAHGSDTFDLVFVDPPTWSTSKAMEGTLDVQRDHVELIDAAMLRLAPGGTLVFSTNARRFELDPALTQRYAVGDIRAGTIPEDFARRPNIHHCWMFRTDSNAG